MTFSTSTSVSDPTTVTGQLCNWVHSLTLDDVPPDIRARAVHLMLDGFACTLSGSHLPWSETAANAIFKFEPPGSCTVIGWERGLGPLSAALINSTFTQGFELDDYHSAAPLHSNSILLPALMAAFQNAAAVGENSPEITGADFLLAYIVGCEVGPRVGLALYGADILSRGWHSGTVFGPAAAAAAVGKLLRLSPSQLEDAQGIACTQAGGLMSAQFGSMQKRMQHGFPARNGLFACLLAKEGYTGIKKVFDQSYGGFLSCFGDYKREVPYLKDQVSKNLGDAWEIERIRVKLHAAMAALHGAIDCAVNLQEKHPEGMSDTSKISKIEIQLSQSAYEHGGWKADAETPLTTTSAQMNVAYITAVQLVDRSVLMAQFSDEALHRPVLRQLMDKTEVIHNKEFDKAPDQWFRTILTLTFDGGEVYSEDVMAPKGVDPAVTNEEIVEKWRMLVDRVIDEKRMLDIEQSVLHIEDLEDIGGLFELLHQNTNCPI